jgi:serine/threonine-protein kinase
LGTNYTRFSLYPIQSLFAKNMDRRTFTHIGRYEVIEELGRGAMGIVYQARDPQIDRLVAIKTINVLVDDAEAQQEYRQRFFLEARAAGRLSHPGIVTIFDVGEDPETHSPYIVMEYVAGQPLSKFITAPSKIPSRRALRYAQQLAEALDYAHAQGVVHRDMKPANILIGKDAHAKITDFGIAKMNMANITHAGHVVGTPAYMSPEQLEGEKVDGRSDLFSLGVILYTMLTGHRPFQGNSAATVSFKVANRDPLPASAFDSAFPPEVDYVIARAMAKDPTARYQTGREMALDLHSILRGQNPRSQGDPAPRHAISMAPVPESTQPHLNGTPPAKIEDTSIRKLIAFVRQKPTKREGIAALVLLCAVFVAAHYGRGPSTNASQPVHAATPPPVAAVQTKPVDVKQVAAVVPVVASKPVAAAVAPKPVPLASTLNLQVEHHLTSATLRVWSDGRLIYARALHGATKKHFVVFKKVEGTEIEAIKLPAGKHRIKVQVEADGYDQSNTIQANLSHDQPRLLEIRCDKQSLGLTLR